MGENLKIMVLMPARGGSKRIVKKNIRAFCGRPMMAWPILALQACDFVEEVIVSTDDEEIAETAKTLGASVPFMRPAELSDDYATTMDVIAHGLIWHEENHGPVDLVLTVYPTAVFLQATDIMDALQLMSGGNCDHVFSGTNFGFPIQRAVKLDGENKVTMFDPKQFNTRSQDLEEAYHDAGQFYLSTADAIKSNIPIFSSSSKMLVLPRNRVVDIDTMEDFTLAEELFKAREARS